MDRERRNSSNNNDDENDLSFAHDYPEPDSSWAANDSVVEDEDGDNDDAPYSPPTDPVFTSNADGTLEVLNGFAGTSMDDIEPDVSAEDYQYGDESLADAVMLELREDAATTALNVTVHVVRGVAYLHGDVPDLEDVGNVEDVAARIPGIREVVDELVI